MLALLCHLFFSIPIFRHSGPSHIIDTTGYTTDTLGDWTEDEKRVDYRETAKFDHDERCQKERDEEYRSFGSVLLLDMFLFM